MKLDTLATKLNIMLKDLESNNSKIAFCAMFITNDEPLSWDFTISASWLHTDSRKSFEIVAKYLRSTLTSKELSFLSRITIYDTNNVFLKTLIEDVGGRVGIVNINFRSPSDQLKFIYVLKTKPEIIKSRQTSKKLRVYPKKVQSVHHKNNSPQEKPSLV